MCSYDCVDNAIGECICALAPAPDDEGEWGGCDVGAAVAFGRIARRLVEQRSQQRMPQARQWCRLCVKGVCGGSGGDICVSGC
jgi:hypothetical protein